MIGLSSLSLLGNKTSAIQVALVEIDMPNRSELDLFHLRLFLGGGFKYFLCSPVFGEMIQSD